MACFNIYTLNALSFLEAYNNSNFHKVIQKSDMILADGIGSVWGYKMLFNLSPERIAGVDFIDEICRLCERHHKSMYLAGGQPGIAEEVAKRLVERFPKLVIAGHQHGYWKEDEEESVVKRINQSGAAGLLVALGQPAQEMFLAQHKYQLKTIVAIGVGGSFDVLSGQLERAPKWIQKVGLEWFYRLIQEPKRIKTIIKLPQYVWLVWRAKIRG